MSVASHPAIDVRNKVSDEEWKLRCDLAAAYRLVAYFGWDDLIFTHMSVRIPGPEHHFLLNPLNLMFEEVTASSLIKIDLEGNKVMDTPFEVNKAGFVIHGAIHMGREDAQCVMHLHTIHGQAVSAMEEGLLPVAQTNMLQHGQIAYHDYEGVALEEGERPRIIADMGDKPILMLRNHGTLTIGSTVGEAFLRMYFLERACEVQVKALSMGRPLTNPAQGVPEKASDQLEGFLTPVSDIFTWPAMLRKAERLDPSFRT